MRHLASSLAAPALTVLVLASCGGATGAAAPSPRAATADARAAAGVELGLPGVLLHGGAGNGPPRPPAEKPEEPATWIDARGTSIVGFGILRLVPSGSGPATFRIRYREVPDGYATTGNLQLFVLPADAFAAKDRAYSGEFLAFERTLDEEKADDEGALRLETSVRVSRETTVLVCYGPWTAPDAGRPAGDVPTFSLDVSSADGSHEWVESEAGEMITTNWTHRAEVTRGKPCPNPRDPVDGEPVYIEVRPMILYDGRMVRATGEPDASPDAAAVRDLRAEAERLAKEGKSDLAADRRERADDLDAHVARADRRLVLTPALAEKFRRVPIRWR